MSLASTRKPETRSQAATWETTKRNYANAGLCHRCAAQAAWGHQCGFSLVEPPCRKCWPLVARLPVSAGNATPWRRFERGISGMSPNHGSPQQDKTTDACGPCQIGQEASA